MTSYELKRRIIHLEAMVRKYPSDLKFTQQINKRIRRLEKLITNSGDNKSSQ